ncbi:MAG: FAD-binding oxidoreductase, partial [Candidatus Nanopelagicales bacterium]|nr:FAD-binding oxidoreductase [Candidatus Nanopelagicales bacterium]
MELTRKQVLVNTLSSLLGPQRFLASADTMAGYLVDWTGNFRGDALAVVRPSSTGEVCLIMDLCTDHQVSLTVQGGNTGLVGGSVPRLSGSEAHSKDQVTSSTESDSVDILLSTTYLCSFEDFDPISGHVTVGAGVTLVQLHEFARTHDLEFGVDLAARDSATVGGMTATNAGGIHVVAHGMMRKQVVGVEAVLPSGEVISTLRGL